MTYKTDNQEYRVPEYRDLDWHIPIQDTIGMLDSDVFDLIGRMDTAESDISTLQTDVSTLQTNVSSNDTDISNLTSRMDTAETNISSNDTDISNLDSRLTTVETDGYFSDSEIHTAVNNDTDHGSTASHNYYTDTQAVSAVESQNPLSPTNLSTTRMNAAVYASRGELLETDDYRTKFLNRGSAPPTMMPIAAQFEDTTPWDLYDFEVDTSESFLGTQCLKNVSGTTGPEAYWYPSSPIDISSLQPSLAFKHSGSGAADIAIKCRDSNSNYFQYRRTVNPGKHATGWHVVDIGPSDTQSGTGADLTSIDLIRLTVGGFTDGTIKVDNFQWTHQPNEGAVMFVFDDGNQTIYQNALPEFEKRGLAGTVGVISSLVDSDSSTMTSAELTELHDKGWSMMSHGETNSDIKGATATQQRNEMENGKEWLLKNNYYNGPDSIIYKGGGYDVQALDIATDYYQAGFTTGSSSSGTSPFYCRNPLNITRPFISGHAVSTIQNIIDRTVDTGSLNALGFHTVSSSGDISPSNLGSVLDYCVNNNIRVLTLDQYLDEHRTEIDQ